MFETPKTRYAKKPQGPVTEGIQTNEQVGAVSNPQGPIGRSQQPQQPQQPWNNNRQPPPQGQNPPQDQRQYSQVPPPQNGFAPRKPNGPKRAQYPPLPESLADVFAALMSLNALRLPPEKPNWNMATDQTKYCVYHRHPGHNVSDCFQFRDIIYDLHEQNQIDWAEMKRLIQTLRDQQGMNDIDCLGSGRRHLGVKPRPLSQCQRPDMDANTNSGVQRYGRQSLWPACAAELQASEARQANHWGMSPNGSEGCPITLVDPAIYCDKKEAGAKEKVSPSPPCCRAHPRTRRKVILEAILQLLGTAQGGPWTPVMSLASIGHAADPESVARDRRLVPLDRTVHINLSTSVGYMSHYDDALYTDGDWYNRTAPLLANPSILDTSPSPLHHNLALRSGRMFHRMYPNASVAMPGQPIQQTSTQQQQDMEEVEPVPGTQYDILKHLDQTPAKISILELIKRSQTHQDALKAFLQRVMVSEDMNPDNLPSVLSIVNKGPTITFSDGELAAPEARKMPLCVTLTINKVAIDASLVDTGASINVCPLNTLRACNISERHLQPTPTTIAAYDNSQRACHGVITLQAELGPLVMSVEFYVLDIDHTYKAILGRPWIESLGAVPSTTHQCLMFPFQVRIVKVKSVTTTHTVEAVERVLPSVWPSNKPVISILDMNYPWAYTFSSNRPIVSPSVAAARKDGSANAKGWDIMFRIGYHTVKGLGTHLQGRVKAVTGTRKSTKHGLGYTIWAALSSTSQSDQGPLTWTLYDHFVRGLVQLGYNTMVKEVPSSAYQVLEAQRPGKKKRAETDPEAQYLEDLISAVSLLFKESEAEAEKPELEDLISAASRLFVEEDVSQTTVSASATTTKRQLLGFVEEFVQEAVVLNIEDMHLEEGLDDGFGIYEIVDEDDPLNEGDCCSISPPPLPSWALPSPCRRLSSSSFLHLLEEPAKYCPTEAPVARLTLAPLRLRLRERPMSVTIC
ncbi:hypothetical protein Taro_001101 [Colocasia esculenta]|uniref:Uncharacterized protein n=1 Tax=Colocasia esculenta TaxID=4460 RepID=A0A843TDS6_COLES|nr:hypothetical protein [Colocasia esculenta]